VVEAKGGAAAGLSRLAKDTQGFRQMTYRWVEDRLRKAGRQDLLDALYAGKLDFYTTLEGSQEVWKIDPMKYFDGTKCASRRPGAATLVIKVQP
jgi:hypothetical protein